MFLIHFHRDTMQKPIPPYSLRTKDIFPPAKDHEFLKDGHDHPFVPLPPRSNGHHPLNAWWLAELSLLAYNEPDFVKSKLDGLGLGLVMRPLLNGVSTQGFIVEGEGFAIVAFRGTEFLLRLRTLRGAITDLLVDFKASLVEAPAPVRGRVHQGFSLALDEVFDQLGGLFSSGRAVWLTGHSLGGALAILAGARLPDVQSVYTFGAPNVGDADFVSGFPARSFRFVHGSDCVTQLLKPPLFSSYRAEGEIVALDRQGRLRPNTVPNPATAELDSAGTSLLDRLSKDALVDHSPLFYALHLWNLFDAQASNRPA